MDGSLAALVAMCVAFFVITVTALLFYLRMQDRLQDRESVIEEYELKEDEWAREKEALVARNQEMAHEARQGPHSASTLTHRVRNLPDPPALPVRERQSFVSSTGNVPNRHQQKRHVQKVFRLVFAGALGDPKLALMRRCCNKWARWVLIRCPGGGGVGSVPRAKFSSPRPIEYFSPADYAQQQQQQQHQLAQRSNSSPTGKRSPGPGHRRQPPQFISYSGNGAGGYGNGYGNGYPHQKTPNGNGARPASPAASYYRQAATPTSPHMHQAQPVPYRAHHDVYTAGGLSGGYPYPSAVRHVEP
eukprot:TRINITY_DN1128_c4_g1_i2.p1 TRINITY_DN1128_c4_g1~~TRINITY_DN1128_c4_g1_i2.p1  ORF type:complete len:302 (+),score=48.35 TRINITY_DN1128_c4_g1_i2:58-963(+)